MLHGYGVNTILADENEDGKDFAEYTTARLARGSKRPHVIVVLNHCTWNLEHLHPIFGN